MSPGLLSASVNILLLHQSESCLAEVEYNEKWEIQDFLKALEWETVGLPEEGNSEVRWKRQGNTLE